MTIPNGVTIRKSDEPKPYRSGPRNLLEHAAQIDDVGVAARMIQDALEITEERLAGIQLDPARRWARLPVDERLRQIGRWLTAECYQCMDLVECSSPKQTVDTND